jgi:LysM repeat protein
MRLIFTILSVLIFTLSAQAAQLNDERAFDSRTHVVQPKETLYKISRQYGISVSAIKNVNKLSSDIIAAGARLVVKIPKENDVFQVHIVRYDEDLAGISEKYLLPTDILTKYNDFDESVVFPGQRIFIKIDKINTKYTYKGEEDNPITDAEIGGADLNATTGNGTATTQNPAQPAQQSASAGSNTPVYTFNTQNQQQSRLKDSLPAGDKAFTIEGYLDAYYALFSDGKNKGDMSTYAMSAPKNGQTGLNTIQLAAIYNDTNLRGNITLQYGDLPTAVYPTDFKYLQQANVGFKMVKHLWLDAGFFKSPVSVEDFPNKNNYSSMASYTRYFEPVLWSGAKLGLEFDNFKLSLFASDRTYSTGNIGNSNPTFGLNMKIYGGKHWLMGLNGMYTQVNTANGKTDRTYGNVFIASNRKHLDVLVYANMGLQQNNTFMSGVLNIRYKITSKFSLFTRGEYFADSSAVVSPLMTSTEGIKQGLTATALSGGFEFKARANHYLRIEARNTQTGNTFKAYKDYMNHNGAPTNQRWEFVITTGIWFGK